MKASWALGADSMDKWNQDELVLEWFEVKSVEKEKNSSWFRRGGGGVTGRGCVAADGTDSLHVKTEREFTSDGLVQPNL